jgi:hypothetical protein
MQIRNPASSQEEKACSVLKKFSKFHNSTICLDWFDGDETMLGVKRKAAGIFFYRSKSVEDLTLLPL